MLLPPICPLQCRPTVSSLTYLQTAKEYCPQGKRRNQHYPHHNPFSAPNPPLLSNAAKIPKFIIPLSPFLLPFPPGASSIRTRRRRKSRTNTCRRFFLRGATYSMEKGFLPPPPSDARGRGDGGRKSTSKLQLRRLLLLLLLLRRGSV